MDARINRTNGFLFRFGHIEQMESCGMVSMLVDDRYDGTCLTRAY